MFIKRLVAIISILCFTLVLFGSCSIGSTANGNFGSTSIPHYSSSPSGFTPGELQKLATETPGVNELRPLGGKLKGQLITLAQSGGVYFVDLATYNPVKPIYEAYKVSALSTLANPPNSPNSIALSRDGTELAIVSDDVEVAGSFKGRLLVVSVAKKAIVKAIDLNFLPSAAVFVSDNSIAVSGFPDAIALIDLRTSKVVNLKFGNGDSNIAALLLTTSGQLLAAQDAPKGEVSSVFEIDIKNLSLLHNFLINNDPGSYLNSLSEVGNYYYVLDGGYGPSFFVRINDIYGNLNNYVGIYGGATNSTCDITLNRCYITNGDTGPGNFISIVDTKNNVYDGKLSVPTFYNGSLVAGLTVPDNIGLFLDGTYGVVLPVDLASNENLRPIYIGYPQVAMVYAP